MLDNVGQPIKGSECIVPLNLPPVKPKLKHDMRFGLMVHDPLRRKFVVLTPEEWVRQNFVAYMQFSLGYPSGLIANEMAIKLNGMSRRCDTVVFDRQAKPLMIVEYKAPSVKITEAVFNQIVRYNMVLKARYLVVSNGLQHYCCHIDYSAGKINFLPAVPSYDEISEQ